MMNRSWLTQTTRSNNSIDKQSLNSNFGIQGTQKKAHFKIVFIGENEKCLQVIDRLKTMPSHTDVPLVEWGFVNIQDNDQLNTHFKELFTVSNIKTVFLSEQTNLLFPTIAEMESRIISSTLMPYFSNPEAPFDLQKLGFLGIQKHLNTPALFDFAVSNFTHFVRLSQFKNNPQHAEVLLREAEYVEFNLNALKTQELGSYHPHGTTGLTVEDACHIMRYVGISDKLKCVNLSQINSSEQNIQYWDALSVMLWYLLEGFTLSNQLNKSNNRKDEYIVFFTDQDLEIQFFHNAFEDRWWFQTEDMDKMVSCALEDYELAKKNELSERILKALDMTLS